MSQTTNTFSITGHIEGIEDGDSILLLTIEGRVGKRFMKDVIHNGKFSFKGEVDSVLTLGLIALGDKFPLKSLRIWIRPGSKTIISGNNYYPTSWKVESNVSEQQDEEIYREVARSLAVEADSAFWVYYREGDKIAQAKSDEERSKLRASTRLLRGAHSKINHTYTWLILNEMTNHPVTDLWTDRLLMYAQSAAGHKSISEYYPEENMELMQELYNRMNDTQKQSSKGKMIHSYIYPVKKNGIGDPMPKGSFFDPEGAEHQITDYLNKDKYILIDFWGVGCRPCIAAFPEMKNIHEQYSDIITIIGISTDRHSVWLEGLEKHQLPWLNFNDFLELGGYPSLYGVHAIPFYVLVTPDGTIKNIWMGYSPGEFKKIIDEITNEEE